MSNGLWSGEDPACDPVVCPVPEALEHGSWTVCGFVPSSTIHFECQPGFALIGSAIIICLMDKSWSDRRPTTSANFDSNFSVRNKEHERPKELGASEGLSVKVNIFKFLD